MKRYTHLDPDHDVVSAWTVFRWAVLDRITRRRRPAPPGDPAPWREADMALLRTPAGSPRLTWIGHASFLVQMAGTSVLVDPVTSAKIGAVVKRHGRPGLTSDQLDQLDLDALCISHNHYDHLDAPTVERLPRSLPVYVPAGLGEFFDKRGFETIQELEWWQSATQETQHGEELKITLVPSRHWSRRGLFDVDRSLWGGYVLEAGGHSVHHAGDSARWDETFDEIGRRFPNLDASILPIGAYEPDWMMEPNHMNPEEALDAFLRTGARVMVPAHWGTFQLSDETLRAPMERLEAAWEGGTPRSQRLLQLAVGQISEA